MQMASYMLPEEHIKEIERLCQERRITQDEIVRRAVAEYLSKETPRSTSEAVPRDIHTRVGRGHLL